MADIWLLRILNKSRKTGAFVWVPGSGGAFGLPEGAARCMLRCCSYDYCERYAVETEVVLLAEGWMRVERVAALTGFTPSGVRSMLRRGAIAGRWATGTRPGWRRGVWLVPSGEVVRLLARREAREARLAEAALVPEDLLDAARNAGRLHAQVAGRDAKDSRAMFASWWSTCMSLTGIGGAVVLQAKRAWDAGVARRDAVA